MGDVKCILIRHGKTPGNLEKRYIGAKTDESLSDLGKEELAALRSKMTLSGNSSQTLFYSGSMKRCTETMGILFPEQNYEILPDLTEIDFGDFEGLNYSELSDNPDYQKWIDSNGTMTFPNGEARSEFIERTVKTLTSTIANATKTLVFVCHGGNIMAFMSEITGKDYFDFQCEPGNGFVIDLSIQGGYINGFTSYHRIFDRVCS